MKNGFELMVWSTNEKGEPYSGSVGGYEINGSMFNIKTGTTFSELVSLVREKKSNDSHTK